MKRILAALAATMLTTCGSYGTLSLQLTDAPPNTDLMASVTVTLSKVEAHLSDFSDETSVPAEDTTIDQDGKWYPVPMVAHEFDLLALRNGVTTALGDIELPEGKITQLRLFIDQAGTNAITLKDGRVCRLDLSQVPPTGVKINEVFKALDIANESVTTAVLDFHLESSIEETGDCSYKLKPVIKMKTSKVESIQ